MQSKPPQSLHEFSLPEFHATGHVREATCSVKRLNSLGFKGLAIDKRPRIFEEFGNEVVPRFVRGATSDSVMRVMAGLRRRCIRKAHQKLNTGR